MIGNVNKVDYFPLLHQEMIEPLKKKEQ